MLEREDNFCNVYPNLALLEPFPLVQVGKQFAAAHVIWKKGKKINGKVKGHKRVFTKVKVKCAGPRVFKTFW